MVNVMKNPPMIDRREYVQDIRELLNDWGDEIPGRILHSDDSVRTDTRIKARKAWVLGVQCLASKGIMYGIYGGDVARLYERFERHLDREGYGRTADYRTKPAQILWANKILRGIVEEVRVS